VGNEEAEVMEILAWISAVVICVFFLVRIYEFLDNIFEELRGPRG
jgi:hypothetical protein